MNWHYIRHARIAIETKSGLQFRVGAKGAMGDELIPAELEFEALEPEGQRRLKKSGETIRQDICEAIAEVRRRDEMRTLIQKYCHNSCMEAARVIEKVSKRQLTQRAVQTWLMDPSKPSSRSCPQWAVGVMRDYAHARSHEQGSDHFIPPPRPWDVEAIDNRTVEMATTRLEIDQRREAGWIKAPIGEYPRRLASLEKRIQDRLDHHDMLLNTLQISLKSASIFDEFKKMLQSAIDAREAVRFEVRQTQHDIEAGFGEFADADSTLDQR